MARPLKHLIAWLAMFLAAFSAQAHQTPGSAISLSARAKALDIIITVPEAEWAFAYGGEAPEPDDLTRRLSVLAENGTAWRIDGAQFSRVQESGVTDIVFRATALAPAKSMSRRFTLRWTGVIDKVASHRVLVSGIDFAGGVLQSEPTLLGVLTGQTQSLDVDLGEASIWRGFVATLALGMHHIAEGADHLVFLLVLLLAAPGVAKGQKWQSVKPVRGTLRHVFLIITAFTIGHSLTLIAGAALSWQLPVQPVEIAIALSVLISAIHAARPIFPGREAWVAGGFGLIHGMAFATVIANFALPPGERALAILGFNLGIELVQIALALLFLPVLLWLCRSPAWPMMRTSAASLAGVAALVWLVQRL
jgi:HupE / UreJ protein